MAEQDIAIDMVSSASRMSAVDGNEPRFFQPRPGLLLRTAAVAGLDATITAVTAMICFVAWHPITDMTSAQVILTILWLALCMSISFAERGLYAAEEIVSRVPNWRKMALAWLQAVAVGALLTFCLAAIVNSETGLPGTMAGTLPGPWLPTLLLAGFVTTAAGRLLSVRIAPGSALLNRTVIIGETAAMHDLMLRLRGNGKRTFDVIAAFDNDDDDDLSDEAHALHAHRSFLGIPLFSGVEALETMIRRDAVDTVLVALPWAAESQVRAIIRRVSMAPVDVYVYHGISALDVPSSRNTSAPPLPLVLACARPIDGWGAVMKRIEDVVLASSILLFISPAMLTIALLIKLTSRGPVFFRQRRHGYNNRIIEVLKFRSMFTHLADADARHQTVRGDKRVTRLGVLLRRYSLDELPQLINVLRGEMSLVGPRPHALATTAGGLALEEAVPDYPSRHRVKPGITGWAQVNGHRGVLDSVEKIVARVNHDLYYIQNWSLRFDLKILWLTISRVFADDNAF
jgi:Undecaprenyl-phosphate glucose phosphotransferase